MNSFSVPLRSSAAPRSAPVSRWRWLALLFLATVAPAATAPDGRMLLQQAEAAMENLSFVAVFELENDAVKVQNVLLQRAVDGRRDYRKESRMEKLDLPGVQTTNVWISNSNGLWQLLPRQALRLDFLDADRTSPWYGFLEGEAISAPEGASYAGRLARLNGRECFVVEQSLPPPLVSRGHRRTPSPIVERIIYLDRQNLWLRRCEWKRQDGSKARLSIAELTVTNGIPDSAFEPAPDTDRMVCDTPVQYSKIMVQYLNSQAFRSIFSQAPPVRDFESSRRHRRWLALGALAAPALVFLYCIARNRFGRWTSVPVAHREKTNPP